MNKKNIENVIIEILKDKIKRISSEYYKIKFSRTNIKILNLEGDVVAYLYYSFKSDKFCELGAITSLSITAYVERSKIGDVLKKININCDVPPYIGYSMAIPRFIFPKSERYRESDLFSFYSLDNINERVLELFTYIEYHILPIMFNYLSADMKLIDDVFANQDYFKYPLSTIIITLIMNDRVSDIDKYIDYAISKKLYDSNSLILAKIKAQIYEYFNLSPPIIQTAKIIE